MTIIQNPRQFKVPDWMLNRKKDVKDGKFSQVVSNTLDMKLREDLERLKKIRAHRGLRHYCAPPPPDSLPTRQRALALATRLERRACRWFPCGFALTRPVLTTLQGACACVVSAPRRPAARAAPSVCPRRRARYLRLRCYYDMLPQRAGGTVRAVYAFLASACAVGLQDILTPPDLSLQDCSHRFLFFLS